MQGAPLSLLEREEISLALTEDDLSPWAVIGRRVGRHPTTVAREAVAGGGRQKCRPAC
jgi:IS30 family transposase